jgi:hypothetical protein
VSDLRCDLPAPCDQPFIPPRIPDSIPEEGRLAILRTLAWPEFITRKIAHLQAELSLCMEARKFGLEEFDAEFVLDSIGQHLELRREAERDAAETLEGLREIERREGDDLAATASPPA